MGVHREDNEIPNSVEGQQLQTPWMGGGLRPETAPDFHPWNSCRSIRRTEEENREDEDKNKANEEEEEQQKQQEGLQGGLEPNL